MSLESAQWIYELQKTNPGGTDPVSEGDNHLRMIKEVLKDSFPSTFDGPQIPDIAGNADKVLTVTNTGTGIEWLGEPVSVSPLDKTIIRSTIQVRNDVITVGDGMYYLPANARFTEVSSGVVAIGLTSSVRHMYIYINTDGDLYTDEISPVHEPYGWFDGDNRCIGAVYQNANGTLQNQYHDGGDYVMYGTKILHGNTYTTGWQTKPLRTPAFADRAQVTFDARSWTSNVTSMYWRPTGTNESNLIAAVEHNEAESMTASWSIYTGYQQTIDVNTGGESLDTYLEGYYMPSGI